MRGHRQTRGERVACTLKVAAGNVLTPSQAPSPVPPDIDFGASEAHHGHYLWSMFLSIGDFVLYVRGSVVEWDSVPYDRHPADQSRVIKP